jgi:predicted transcriptional regulator
MILAYNDITGTNPINIESDPKRAEKKAKKKHTSYNDTIFKIVKNHPHHYILDNYINRDSNIDLSSLIPLIKSLQKEENERNKLIKQVSRISNNQKSFSIIKNIKTKKNNITKIVEEVNIKLVESEKQHKKTLKILSSKIYELGGLKKFVEKQQVIVFDLGKKIIHHTPQNTKNLKKLVEKTNLIKLLVKQIKLDKQIMDGLKNQIEMSINLISTKEI